MTDSRLLPCPSCARHVRANEHTCPHCAAALTNAFGPPPEVRTPSLRLTRAARFALGGGASALVVTACTTSMPIYGAPGYYEPPRDAGREARVPIFDEDPEPCDPDPCAPDACEPDACELDAGDGGSSVDASDDAAPDASDGG